MTIGRERTPTTAPTEAEVGRLRAVAAAAAQDAADAVSAAEAAAEAAAKRRAARLREWDEQTLAAFDQAALQSDTRTALQRVHEAVAGAGDVFAAWLAYQVAHRRLYERTMEANNAATKLRRPQPGSPVTSVQEDLNAVVKAAISDAASRTVAAEQDERASARDRYGAGAQDG